MLCVFSLKKEALVVNLNIQDKGRVRKGQVEEVGEDGRAQRVWLEVNEAVIHLRGDFGQSVGGLC